MLFEANKEKVSYKTGKKLGFIFTLTMYIEEKYILATFTL